MKMNDMTKKYIMVLSDLVDRAGNRFVVGINQEHCCVVTSTNMSDAKVWATRAAAHRWLTNNADCGYGLNASGATIIEIKY